MINEGKIAKGEKIVLVHTGGAPAIYTPFHRAEMEKELMEGYHLL
jgi:1-aminocyclopropane-1-carboxylate deaminase/D-cysteine desulfhydrase-like pyridoxal-dependent ACC family enzyme